ncbi:hypothetical protein J4217_01000 [Candidatus Pacearchaeota archaeon]|nr:hypothetical protein [Candidatus Pacearchaeota archaeon]
MKAVAKCPICKRELTTDCKGCIDLNEAPHMCNGRARTVKVQWYIIDSREKGDKWGSYEY